MGEDRGGGGEVREGWAEDREGWHEDKQGGACHTKCIHCTHFLKAL